MERIWSIQYLRAFAALAVVFYHALETSPYRFEIGAAGVDLFFVISGFIMWSLTDEKSVGAGPFLWRRAIRIVPLYWAATLAAVAVTAVKPDFFYRADISFENIWKSLLFVPHDSAIGYSPVLWQGWTLNYEMFFYLLVGAALTRPARERLGLLTLTLIALTALGVLMAPEGPAARTYMSALLLEFLAGVFIAHTLKRGLRLGVATSAALIGGGVLAYTALQASGMQFAGPRVLLWGAPAVAIVLGAVHLEQAGRIGRHEGLRLVGDASYSLYLTHSFVVAAVLWTLPDLHFAARALLAAGLSTAVAVALFLGFEKPTTDFLKALPARRRPA